MTVVAGPNAIGRNVVQLDACGRTYRGPPPVIAIRPTTLTIGHGQYIALMGASGSGKSTLLNLLGLLDSPNEGALLFEGIDTRCLSDAERAAVRSQRIGFVFQSFNLLPYRTVTENVRLSLLYNGTPRRLRTTLALEAIERVGVHHRRDALASQLSGGERQRVAIARAVVAKPALLLCDEPTGNLDSRSSEVVLNELDSLHQEGLTIIVVTHNPDVAERANRLLLMQDGVLTEGDFFSGLKTTLDRRTRQ